MDSRRAALSILALAVIVPIQARAQSRAVWGTGSDRLWPATGGSRSARRSRAACRRSLAWPVSGLDLTVGGIY